MYLDKKSSTERQLNSFLKLLNNLDNNINFTCEIGFNKSLNFLDLTISQQANNVVFNIFRKPTTTDTIIPASSNQSNNVKHAVFHSLIFRLINVPLSPKNFNIELNTIKQIAVNNGYDTELVNNILKQKIRYQTRGLLFKNHNNHSSNGFNYCSFTYIPKLSSVIKHRLNKFGIIASVSNKRNLHSLIVNNKSKPELLDYNGVYQVNCKDCDAIYIGQCGRAIKYRIKEHKYSINHNIKSTGFSEHCIAHNHNLDENNIQILHVQRKGRKLNLLESLEIKKALSRKKHLVNNQTELNTANSPLLLSFLPDRLVESRLVPSNINSF